LEEEDGDDILDEMAKFVEGADEELIVDHTASIADDEKINRRKAMKEQMDKQLGKKPDHQAKDNSIN
jgi:hypothetical protein